MGYIESSLLPNERVVHRAKLHWIVILPGLVVIGVGALLLIPVMLMASQPGAPGAFICPAFFLGIGLLLLVVAIVRLKSTELAVTNLRLVAKAGVISRRTIEMNVAKIENVSVQQGIMGRTIGYGSVVVTGTGGTREAFNRIGSPADFHRAVYSMSNPSAGPAVAAYLPPSAPSVAAAPAAAPEPRMTVEGVTRITVKTPEGKQQTYKLETKDAAAIGRAVQKLTAAGNVIVTIQ